MSKTVFFYSSVQTKKTFSIQSYYRNDILILKDLGYKVALSKKSFDFLLFWKYDIAFIYFYRYGLIAALFAKLFGKKVLFTGGIDALDKNVATPRQRYIQKILFKLCNLFSDTSILVSQTDQSNVKDIYGGKLPSNCALSFHVIDFDSFEFKGDFLEKKHYFVTIAWMVSIENVYRKGVDRAIRIFASIRERIPDYKFYIVGPSGAGSDYIQSLISELHLEESVIYLGTIQEHNKINLLKESQFYIQLSAYEGFGIAAMEALAAGCCVVHSGRGGLRDCMGSFGYKVDIDNEDTISRLILELCRKKTDVEHLKSGIQYVKSNFSYQTRLGSFKQIFRKL